ncbi:unnamed protein product [Symbiodinium sp. CCMP2592]|nr:unnamed protein product [Symbiodinium sp. CCMP2592]
MVMVYDESKEGAEADPQGKGQRGGCQPKDVMKQQAMQQVAMSSGGKSHSKGGDQQPLMGQNMGAKGKGKEKGKDKGKSKGKDKHELTVCIRGLSYHLDAETVEKDFAECGELASCRCLKTEDGQLKGIAFVEFKDEEAVKKALEFNKTEYSGRAIYVSKACDREGKGKGKDKGKGKGGWQPTDVMKQRAMQQIPISSGGKSHSKGGDQQPLMGQNMLAKGKGKEKGKDKGKSKGKDKHELTICIRGLSYHLDAETVEKDFAECGELASCRCLKTEAVFGILGFCGLGAVVQDGQLKGIAFVEFKDEEAVKKALEFNKTGYSGRTIYVSKACDREGGWQPTDVMKQRAMPRGDQQPLMGQNMLAKGKGKEKGKDKGKSKGKDKGKGKGSQNDELTVCIRGLSYHLDAETVEKDFAECGELASCRCLKTEDGQLKGIAFVEFKDEEAVKKALEFNKTEYSGRTIYVSKACDHEGKGKGKDKGKGKGRRKATEQSSRGWNHGQVHRHEADLRRLGR